MLLPCPALWCSVGFRKWEGPGMLPPTWPKPTSLPIPEVSDWPERLCLKDWGGGGGQPASDSSCDACTGKGGTSPACPGHPVSSPIGGELEVGEGEEETLFWNPLGAPLSVERDHGICGWGLWIIDFRKSWWTQAGTMREELQWLRVGLIESGWWE